MVKFRTAALAALLTAVTPAGRSQGQAAPAAAQTPPPAATATPPAAPPAQAAPAAAPAPDASQPTGEVLDLPAGGRAPWAGMLIRQADLAQWMVRIRDLQWQLDHEVQLAEQRAALQLQQSQVDTRLAQSQLALHDQAFAAEREDWRNRLTRETAREEEMEARARRRLRATLISTGIFLVAGFAGGVAIGAHH